MLTCLGWEFGKFRSVLYRILQSRHWWATVRARLNRKRIHSNWRESMLVHMGGVTVRQQEWLSGRMENLLCSGQNLAAIIPGHCVSTCRGKNWATACQVGPVHSIQHFNWKWSEKNAGTSISRFIRIAFGGLYGTTRFSIHVYFFHWRVQVHTENACQITWQVTHITCRNRKRTFFFCSWFLCMCSNCVASIHCRNVCMVCCCGNKNRFHVLLILCI